MISHQLFHRRSILALLAVFAAVAFLFILHLRAKAMQTMPSGLTPFNVSDPPPMCGQWRQHMPTTRDPKTYRLYIEARKVWRSKIAWQFTKEEAQRILTDVRLASQNGDWGARALMAHFHLRGLGPLPSNHVLDPDPVKAIEITRMAVAAGQPWGFYDLGVAYEYGYGGVPYNKNIALAYYLKAAQLGSPEAQMALADAYVKVQRFDAEETMEQCAYRQGHGPAAYALGIDRSVSNNFKEAITFFHDGVKFGCKDCANVLDQLFEEGYWIDSNADERKLLKELGIVADAERANRYKTISEALEINPDLKLNRLDQVLPLPPAKLPDWHGVADAIEPESNGPPRY